MSGENKIIQIEIVTNGEGDEQRRLIINNPEEVEIISKAQREAFKRIKENEQERRTDKRGDFVMGQNEAIKELEGNVLTIADRRQFMMLTLYMKPGNSPLMRNGKPLTTLGIAEVWNVSRPQASLKLTKFEKLGLIHKSNTRPVQFYINKKYFRIGKTDNSNDKFVKLFQRKLTEVIRNLESMQKRKNNNNFTKKKVELMDVVGLLQVVMPYFHYQSYYLTSNPDEDICFDGLSVREALDKKRLHHLPKTVIGEKLTGKKDSRRIVDKYMDLLQKAGALMVLKYKNRTRYLIHPYLMYRTDDKANDEYTKYVLSLFGQHEDPLEDEY